MRAAVLNPLRVLDDKRPHVRALLADAPLMVDHLCDDCAAHFATVRAGLDALGVPYVLNPRWSAAWTTTRRRRSSSSTPGLGAQSGIGGGGRYDGLMAELGGQQLSGIGFGLGRGPHGAGGRGRGNRCRRTPARCDGLRRAAGNAPRGPCWCGWPASSGGPGCATDLAYGGRALKSALKAADGAGAPAGAAARRAGARRTAC